MQEPIAHYIVAVTFTDADGRPVTGTVSLDLDTLERLLALRRDWYIGKAVASVVDLPTGRPPGIPQSR